MSRQLRDQLCHALSHPCSLRNHSNTMSVSHLCHTSACTTPLRCGRPEPSHQYKPRNSTTIQSQWRVPLNQHPRRLSGIHLDEEAIYIAHKDHHTLIRNFSRRKEINIKLERFPSMVTGFKSPLARNASISKRPVMLAAFQALTCDSLFKDCQVIYPEIAKGVSLVMSTEHVDANTSLYFNKVIYMLRQVSTNCTLRQREGVLRLSHQIHLDKEVSNAFALEAAAPCNPCTDDLEITFNFRFSSLVPTVARKSRVDRLVTST